MNRYIVTNQRKKHSLPSRFYRFPFGVACLWVYLSFLSVCATLSHILLHRSVPNHFELSAANLGKINITSKFFSIFLQKQGRKRFQGIVGALRVYSRCSSASSQASSYTYLYI